MDEKEIVEVVENELSDQDLMQFIEDDNQTMYYSEYEQVLISNL